MVNAFIENENENKTIQRQTQKAVVCCFFNLSSRQSIREETWSNSFQTSDIQQRFADSKSGQVFLQTTVFQRPPLHIFTTATSRKQHLTEEEIEETMSNSGSDLS